MTRWHFQGKTIFIIVLFIFLLFLPLKYSYSQEPPPPPAKLNVTMRDTLVTDVNGNGQADPGDTVRYTVTVANCGTVTAEEVILAGVADQNTNVLTGRTVKGELANIDPQSCGATPAPSNTTASSSGGSGDGGGGGGGGGPVVVVNTPYVLSSTPANGSANNPTNTTITLNFSEAVDIGAGAIALECPVPVNLGFNPAPALPATGITNIVINPIALLPDASTCRVTVAAALVQSVTTGLMMATDFIMTFTTEAPPSVLSVLPLTLYLGNAVLNSDIVITFDEPVNVAGNWFTITCGISGLRNVADTVVTPSGGGTTYTVNPNADFAVGEICGVTIDNTLVTDADAVDPPDQMLLPFNTNFNTVPADTAPMVDAATMFPAPLAFFIDANTNITVPFTENVNIAAGAFNLQCPLGNPISLTSLTTLPATNVNSISLDPDITLPQSTLCQFTVFAAGITDNDPVDPPDNMAADFVMNFTTIADPAPTVQTIIPATGSTSVPLNTTIEVTFNELVDIASAAAFSLECPLGTPMGFTVTTPAILPASATTYIITPAGSLPAATLCTVTVFAAAVTDTDLNDPFDNMAADFTANFTTEAPPSVTGTTPADTATGVATGANIVLTFSEPVNVSGPSFSMFCGVTPIITSNSGTGTNTITLDPVTNLPTNTLCTVTVVAAQVSDSDVIDPPDLMAADYVFSFTTLVDAAPTASSALDGAVGVATNANIPVNFSEPVDVVNLPTATFTLECPAGSPIAFTVIPALPTTNQTAFILDPNTNLPATTTCTVTVEADNVTDTDVDEPPDNMAADFVFSFDTLVDLAPTVDQAAIVPASTSTGPNSASLNNPVSTTPTITIPFSEAVDAAAGAFTLGCPAAVGVTVVPVLPTTNQNSLDISPSVALTPGANCTLTVVAANITDTDGDDPPNLMVTDYTLSFSVDTAPAETLTETEVGNVFQDVTGAGATNVDLDSNLQVTFDEAVTVTFPANGLQCPAGNNIAVTVTTNNAATIVLDPDINLPLNTTCVLNIPAANLADVDTADAPDNPAVAVNHSFQTANDNAPTVTTNPANAAGNVAVNNNITVTFNEAVTLTGAWFDLDCTVSGNRVSTGELTGTGITIIENTPDLIYTIDPTVDFANGDTCTITIDSANTVDNDVIDGPNELDGDASADIINGDADDYVATFSTTDLAPQVVSTVPVVAAFVGANQVVTLNFSEAVDVAVGAFSWDCPNGTPITGGFTPSVPLPANGITTIDLTPANPLPFGTACRVTVESTLVTDDDAIDPPNQLDGQLPVDIVDGDADDFTLNFTVDTQATEALTEVEVANVFGNAAGASNVDLDSNIRVTFSEAVTVGLTSFDLDCPAGSDIAFTVAGSGTNIITIDPTPATLPINTLCDFDIIAANITDVDANDPPDVLAADVNYTFTTVNDNPPSVTSAEAEVSNVFTALPFPPSTYADADTNLRVTFDEAVTVAGNWAELNCTSSGIQNVSGGLAVTDADPVFTLNPTANLTPGEDCTLTIFAAQVTDDDAIDPPDIMTTDAVYTFTVADVAPRVQAPTVPLAAAIVPNNQTVTINFTELVDIAAGGITIECNAVAVPFTPALPQNNISTITLTPSAALPNGAACTVTLESTLITDDDTVDGADDLDGQLPIDTTNGDADDFTLTFTVDDQPTVTSAEAEVSNVFTALSFTPPTYADADTNLQITFSEAVTVTGNWASLTCVSSGTQSVGGGTLAVTDADPIFTLNPNTDLTPSENCTLTIFAAQVTDDDAADPPNPLVADAIYTFTVTDTAPRVLPPTTPVAAATVPNNQAVTINFTELVDIAAGGITFECPAGSPVAFTPALPQNNVNSITLTPSAALPNGAACTVTLESTLITDDDAVDGPNDLDGQLPTDTTNGDADDFVLTFTVDQVPTVTNITPANTTQITTPTTGVQITFSENVNITAGGVTVECPVGSPAAFTPTTLTNANTITLTPTTNWTGGQTCTVTLVATNVTDNDGFDPPNELDGDNNTVEGGNFVSTFTVPPVANDDAYNVTRHLTFAAPAATEVDANDQLGAGTITGFGGTIGTANGTATGVLLDDGVNGALQLNANGTFTFYPPANPVAASTDFFYTVTGGDTASITFTYQAELVWFVDNTPTATTCTGDNNGTQACPEDTLTDVAAVDTVNDYIYITNGNYTCGITLENNEDVIGDGSSQSLQTFTGITPVTGSSFPAIGGTKPSLTSAVADCFTLSSVAGNTHVMRGFTIGATGNFAGIVGNGFGTLTVNQVDISGAGQTVDLNNGALAVTFDSLQSTSSDATSAAIEVTNASGSFTVTGNTAITSSANAGVFLGTNSATFTFADLDINPNGGQRAFHATSNTGTITTTSGTIITTTGTAVEIVGVSSASRTPLNMTLTSVSTNGAANGIILSNTSDAGTGFTIAGTGGAGSGGTIQNTSGDGISLNEVVDVNLTAMNIQNNLGNGIYGTLVNGLNLTNVDVINNADNDAIDEAGIHLVNLLGTSAWNNLEVADSLEDNVRVLNNGTNHLTQLTITNALIRDTSVASPGNNGLLIQADGSANMTVDVVTSDFLRNRANGVQIINNGAGTVDAEVGGVGSDFTDNNIGVNIAHNGSGNMNFDVTSGNFNSTLASPININLGGASTVGAIMQGTVSGNIIDNNNSLTGPGIRVTTNGAGTLTILAQNNTITEIANRGIEMIARDGNSRLNATVWGNNINLTDPSSADAIHIAAGAISTDTVTICADLNGDNVLANQNSVFSQGINGIRIRQRFASTTFILEDYAGGATDTTAVQNFLAARNTGGDTYVADLGGAGFMTTSDCTMPTLLAAGGENPTSNDTASLGNESLPSITDEALTRWSGTGLNPEQIARLQNVTFSLSDLPDGVLAYAYPSHIELDVTAAGYGWFVDATPADNLEFEELIALTQFQAGATSPAYGLMDLLTVILHEEGHILGLDDLPTEEYPHVLMADTLPTGTRRIPTEGLAAKNLPPVTDAHPLKVDDSPQNMPALLQAGNNVSVVLGSIPAGKQITVMFDVQIKDPLPVGTGFIAAQAYVTGKNVENTPSDDPDTAPYRDATITTVGAVQFISLQADKTLAARGDAIFFRITFANPKDIPLTQVVIEQVFDNRFENLKFVSSSIGQGRIEGNRLVIDNFTLAPGQVMLAEVTATLSRNLRGADRLTSMASLTSPDASRHESNTVTITIMPGSLPATGQRQTNLQPFYLAGFLTLILVLRLTVQRIKAKKVYHA